MILLVSFGPSKFPAFGPQGTRDRAARHPGTQIWYSAALIGSNGQVLPGNSGGFLLRVDAMNSLLLVGGPGNKC